MAHLQATLNAGFMACRDSREREKARRQGNFVAVGKFCPGVREIEVVAQPRKNIIAKFTLDAVTAAGAAGLEASFIANENQCIKASSFCTEKSSIPVINAIFITDKSEM